MTTWLIVVLVAVVVVGFAWWSSGRTKRRAGVPDTRAEVARGNAQAQSYLNRSNINNGPHP